MKEPFNLSRATKTICDADQLQRFGGAQRLVFAVVHRTLSEYHRWHNQSLTSSMRLLGVAVLLGVPVGFGLIAGVEFGLRPTLGDNTVYAVLGTASAAILVAVAIRLKASSKSVRFFSGSQIDRLKIGRLEVVFHSRPVRSLVFILALLMGMEVGVFWLLRDELNFAGPQGLSGSIVVAVDNMCYGVFFDLFELYRISLSDPIEHNTLSSSVFLGFRTAFDVVLVYFVYVVIVRSRMTQFISRFPAAEEPDVERLQWWIDRTVIDKAGWIRQFPDEIVFLMIVDRFLAGDASSVHDLAEQWPQIKVDQRVKDVFVSDGKVVFSSVPDEVEFEDPDDDQFEDR